MTESTELLARIGIDAEALLNHREHDRHSLNAQRRLIETLCDYGLLEALGTPDARALLDAIEQLSPTWRDRWTKTLDALHGYNRVHVADGPQTMGDTARAHPLPKELQQTLDVLVVGKDAAGEQGVPEQTGYSQRTGEPELVMADSVDLCATIKAIRRMRNHGNFPEGTPRDEIRDAVLAPLARLSNEVTILDRFFLTNKSGDHVEWLITALDGTLRPGSTVRILAGWPKERHNGRERYQSRGQALGLVNQRLADFVGGGHVAEVKVVLAKAWPSWQDARRPDKTRHGPHNRHLRFSCGMAVMTHEGFDRLGSDTIEKVDGFTWQLVSSFERLKDVSSFDRVEDLSRSEGNVGDCPMKVEITLPESAE